MVRHFFTALLLFVGSQNAGAEIITRYNFNTYDGDAAVISADSGNSVMTLAGTLLAWPADELSAETGTLENAFGSDPAGLSLGLGNNGQDGLLTRTATVELETTGFSDLTWSVATAGSNSAYSTMEVSYSLNGTDFIDTGFSTDPSSGGSFVTHSGDLSGFTGLNDASSVFVRLTFEGQNLNQNQILSVDNLQFNATAVPEPRMWAMSLLATGFFAAVRWYRRRDISHAVSTTA